MKSLKIVIKRGKKKTQKINFEREERESIFVSYGISTLFNLIGACNFINESKKEKRHID